jgi:transglutaminase-like putative cysteine protease
MLPQSPKLAAWPRYAGSKTVAEHCDCELYCLRHKLQRMHQKVRQIIVGKALAFAVFLSFTIGLPAQPTNVLIRPPAEWLRPVEWVMPNQAVRREESEGTRYLLYELQENPAQEEEFVRVVLLMENETGVQDSGSLTIEFDPSFQKLILHRVQIHRAGQILERLDPAKIKIIQPEVGLNQHVYTGAQTALLFVEDLRVGDALEYSYTIRGANPILAGHYASRFIVQSSVPVDRQRFRVVWPSAKPLHHRQHLTTVAPIKTTWQQGVEYVWDFAELPAITYEDLLPIGYELYPYVELSDFASWRDVVDWAVPLYTFPNLNLPTDLQELIQQWRGAATTEERGRLALQFVQDDLRYTGLELGPDSYQPAHPVETFQLRYGDCKGKVALLCAILRELNIEAYPVLVNTSARSAIAHRLPSPFAFNHVIVKLLWDGPAVWVDPTRSHQGGLIADRYLPHYGQALVVKPGVAELENLPSPGTNHALVLVTSTYQINDYETPASLRVETVYHGSEADDMRETLARNNLQSTAKDYLNYYSRFYPEIESRQPLVIADDRVQNILRITEDYQIRNLWETNDSSLQLQATFPAETLHGMLPVPSTRIRTRPLRVTYPLQREQEVIVHLPDDSWNISDTEERVEHEAFSFLYQRKFSDKNVRFIYRCETKLKEVAAENVAGYLKKRDEMDDLLGDTLFRPDNRPQAIWARLNWLMVILGCFGAIGTMVFSLWLWRATRIDPAVLSNAPPPLPEEARLQGLAGWLILVGLGICAAPIWRAVLLGQNWESYLSMSVWQMVATPQGEYYHPLYGPLLIFEFLTTVVFLGFNLLVIGLFFARRAVFPKAFIIFMFANVFYLLIDEIAGAQIPSITAETDSAATREIYRTFASAFIWSAYMVRSRRVKLTFIR